MSSLEDFSAMNMALGSKQEGSGASPEGDCLVTALGLGDTQLFRLEMTITDSYGQKFVFYAYKRKAKAHTKDSDERKELFISDASLKKFKTQVHSATLRSIGFIISTNVEDAYASFPLGGEAQSITFLKSFASTVVTVENELGEPVKKVELGELVNVNEVPVPVQVALKKQADQNKPFHVVLGVTSDALVDAMKRLRFEKQKFEVKRTDPETKKENIFDVLAWSQGNADYMTPEKRRIVKAARKPKAGTGEPSPAPGATQ